MVEGERLEREDTYTGLRKSAQAALKRSKLDPNQAAIFKITFTPLGWMQVFANSAHTTPSIQKMTYTDPK